MINGIKQIAYICNYKGTIYFYHRVKNKQIF